MCNTMGVFQYNALTAGGRLMRGTIEATSPDQATEMLQEMQLTVNEVEQVTQPVLRTPMSRDEFVLFNQQLASITRAGVPLSQGLRQLAHDLGSRRMQRTLSELADELDAGVNIDQAIEKRKQQFPPLYGLLLKAGLQSGRLAEMLTRLNHHLELVASTRRIIVEALSYPLVVLAITLAIVMLLFMAVVPTYAGIMLSMFDDFGSLPWLTQAVITVARWMPVILVVVAVVLVATCLVWWSLSASAGGRRLRERIIRAVPLLGRIWHAGLCARMAEGLALLVAAGVPLPEALRLAVGATGSELLRDETDRLATGVENGQGLMEQAATCRVLPRLFLYSMQLGSQRNELQDHMHNLSDMYVDRARFMQTRLQAMLQPVLLIFLGLLVGATVVAMFLPLIRLVSFMGVLM
ncbi:MAG TPA: type II secretion system F family protein [Phycisphaerales bacterium]|nr:type II secretion system F family protein [Phycisphaerales bacterium]